MCEFTLRLPIYRIDLRGAKRLIYCPLKAYQSKLKTYQLNIKIEGKTYIPLLTDTPTCWLGQCKYDRHEFTKMAWQIYGNVSEL